MAILEVEPLGRTNVGWVGGRPTDEAREAFAQCGFTILDRPLTDDDLLDRSRLAGLGAVVFIPQPDNPSLYFNAVRAYVRRLLDFDCRVFVVPDDIRSLPLVYNALLRIGVAASNLPEEILQRFDWQKTFGRPDPVPPLPHVSIYPPGARWSEIAGFLLRNRAGAAPNDNLKIVFERRRGAEIALKPNPRLLKRAFADCTEVHLTPLTQGKSGLCVYRAHPLKGTSHLMPLFVKAGERRKILQEFRNYQIYVEPFLPFHLGPRLNYARCCLGGTHGLLVGDLIDASERLETTARGGRSGPAISCLFDRTLQAWYRTAENRSVSIADSLRRRLPFSVPDRRLAAARDLGARRKLAYLKKLFMRCKGKPVKFARIHGDLHVNNVMVRGHEALVLDFYAHNDGPMLLDVATMETSLLVEGFDDHPESFARWLQSILPLYDTPKIDMMPRHGDPRDINHWFHESARQLRHHALRLGSPDQYAAVLALALLVKASKDVNKRGPEDERRAAAYLFAERLLENNFGP